MIRCRTHYVCLQLVVEPCLFLPFLFNTKNAMSGCLIFFIDHVYRLILLRAIILEIPQYVPVISSNNFSFLCKPYQESELVWYLVASVLFLNAEHYCPSHRPP